MTSLLIATSNPGKVAELKELLDEHPLSLCDLADFPGILEVDETGQTFNDNARLKARGYALRTGSFTLADDSGIEVVALEGRPGVTSARYAGAGSSDQDKMVKLLSELEMTGSDDRRARFVCSIALADAGGDIILTSEGICEGTIASEPRGSGGFGYDQLFVPNGYHETFGELSAVVKQKISHRARAFEQIIPLLRDYIAV